MRENEYNFLPEVSIFLHVYKEKEGESFSLRRMLTKKKGQ